MSGTSASEAQTYPEPPVDDPLTVHAVGSGRWGSPSDPATELDPGAELLPGGYDYSAGILVGAPLDDDAIPGQYHPQLLKVRVSGISPKTYQAPHEATHRRFEPIQRTPINQAAAGFTLVAPPNQGLHYIKLLGCFLTLDAAGTLKFVQGDLGGIVTADMSGTINLGGTSNSPLALGIAPVENPWHFTAPDQAFGIVTATGKAQGWVVWCYSPYDS